MNTEAWKIKDIRIDGLLYRHNIYYRIDPKINILGGANGSGKSTILHALAYILLNGLDDEEHSELDIHCEALFDSMEVELNSGMKFKLRKDVTSSKELVDTQQLAGINRKHFRISEKMSFEGSVELPKSGEYQLAKHIIYVNSSDLAIQTISQLNEKSGPSKRPGKTVLDVLLKDAMNARNQLFAAQIGNALQNGNKNEIQSLRKLFLRFEKAVARFMPQYTLANTSTLTFTPNDDPEKEIKYYRLSTGEKQLLYILLIVSNTLGESTILMLDEVDTGLHIDWKKRLFREILPINPHMQVIAATHYPSLIDGWYDHVKEVSQLYTDNKENLPSQNEAPVKEQAIEK